MSLPRDINANFYVLSFFYVTGCRLSEIANIDEILLFHHDIIRIRTTKNNNERIFHMSDFSFMTERQQTLMKLYVTSTTPYKALTIIKKYMKKYLHTDTSAGIISHIFRYMYINRLYMNGISEEEIRTKVGHKSIDTTRSYISNIDRINW